MAVVCGQAVAAVVDGGCIALRLPCGGWSCVPYWPFGVVFLLSRVVTVVGTNGQDAVVGGARGDRCFRHRFFGLAGWFYVVTWTWALAVWACVSVAAAPGLPVAPVHVAPAVAASPRGSPRPTHDASPRRKTRRSPRGNRRTRARRPGQPSQQPTGQPPWPADPATDGPAVAPADVPPHGPAIACSPRRASRFAPTDDAGGGSSGPATDAAVDGAAHLPPQQSVPGNSRRVQPINRPTAQPSVPKGRRPRRCSPRGNPRRDRRAPTVAAATVGHRGMSGGTRPPAT